MRVAEFINIVGNFNRLQKHEDVLWWKADSRGIFKVGATYRLMEQPSQQNPTCHGNKFGSAEFLIKYHVIWLIAKEATLTQDNAIKMGIMF